MRLSAIAAGLFAGSMALSAFAAAQAGDLADKALGVWLRPNKGWHVEFSMCGDKLCGEVISGEGKDKKTGESVVGVKMLYDLEKSGEDSWSGKMYNPGDGGTYKGKVKVLNDNEIKMSGCMMGFICRSETWPRVEAAANDDAAADDAASEDAPADDAADAPSDDASSADETSDDAADAPNDDAASEADSDDSTSEPQQ